MFHFVSYCTVYCTNFYGVGGLIFKPEVPCGRGSSSRVFSAGNTEFSSFEGPKKSLKYPHIFLLAGSEPESELHQSAI
jgi:hypothetical protein